MQHKASGSPCRPLEYIEPCVTHDARENKGRAQHQDCSQKTWGGAHKFRTDAEKKTPPAASKN